MTLELKLTPKQVMAIHKGLARVPIHDKDELDKLHAIHRKLVAYLKGKGIKTDV